VLGEPTGVFHVLETARQFTLRVGEGLAVFLGDQGRQFVGVFDEELAQREEDVGALGERGITPTVGGATRDRNDVVDELRVGDGDVGVDITGRRVEDE